MLGNKHLDVFRASVAAFTCVWQGTQEDVQGSKGSQPFPNRTQPARGKVTLV